MHLSSPRDKLLFLIYKKLCYGRAFCFCIFLTIRGFYDIIMDELEFVSEVIKMNPHRKKMIAPIVVSVIMILYCVVYFGFLITLLPGIWKYALGILPLALSVLIVKVCIERINEIKKGEEDDISKY